MKKTLRNILIHLLTLEASLVLKRFRPKIIAVVGSVGKTTTKDAIYAGLSDSLFIRKNEKSFNSEIGIPLTILGLQNAWDNPFHWIKNLIKGCFVLFSFKYPDWLVLEVGIDKPGDMKRVGKWLKPDMIVMTAFGTTPVHVEAFSSPEKVWEEKRSLIRFLKKGGTLILNIDDERIMEGRSMTTGSIVTYGIENPADVRGTHYHYVYEKSGVPQGVSFKAEISGNTLPVSINRALGVQHVYPTLAAFAVAKVIGTSFVEVSQSLQKYRPPKGRMNIVEGMNQSSIIDDSYNSSPVALKYALDGLITLDTPGRKIAVIGDMLELGEFSEDEHRKAGKYVAKIGVSKLYAIGKRAKEIARSAIETGMSEEDVVYAETYTDVIDTLRADIQSGDIILVKGSQGSGTNTVRLERLIKEIMADPDEAPEVLVRQEIEWGRK